MLVWVAALHCEAKPVIDYYRLQKSKVDRAFDLYENGDTICVISGVGKTAMAAATAWTAGLNSKQTSISWINIGIAGSATHAVGSAIWVNQISDVDSQRQYRPIPGCGCASDFGHMPCRTLNQPSSDYSTECIFDMEASAFFNTACRFSSVGQVQCIKIISDNPYEQVGRNKSRISEIIAVHTKALAAFATCLQESTANVE